MNHPPVQNPARCETSMPSRMKVVQCWDDGVLADLRLTRLLREAGARATFNLSPGLHSAHPESGRDPLGGKLTWPEMREAYEGFDIGNHSLTHPHLDRLAPPDVQKEVVEGRERLEQFFQRSVEGFAFPYGTFNSVVCDAVRQAGHRYARTVQHADPCFPPADRMRFHPTCHFLADDFLSRYEAARMSGVFYFWGHSFELRTEALWATFARHLDFIRHDPLSEWADLPGLFSPSAHPETP